MIRKLTAEHRRSILRPADLTGSTRSRALSRTYDACVVGSGPGGAVTALTLAEAGLKTVLIERGPLFAPEEFNFQVLDMSGRLGHVEPTSSFRTLLFQGNGVGGGSLVFGAVAMKPPNFIFDQWQNESGVLSINRSTLQTEYDFVAEMMSVTRQNPELENRPNAVVRRMAESLGQPEGLELVHRYTQGCAGMGLCNLGCGLDLKGTMANSFIPAALETGNLTILTEAEVIGLGDSPGASGYASSGVGIQMRDFTTGQPRGRAFVKSKRTVLAAGSYFSSGLLLRSARLPGKERIGRKVFLQPHAQIFALFDEPMTEPGIFQDKQYLPYNGVPAIYEFTGMLEQHRYFWLASILFPANLATFIANLDPQEHFQLMRRFHYTMSITLTIRDDPERSLVRIREGKPELQFRESRRDIESLRTCLLHAARSLLDSGARRVFLPLLRPVRIEKHADLDQIRRVPFSYNDLLLYSDHTSGGNPYARDPERGVTSENGRLFGTRNVYLADSSLFPSAPGVNPSWTIMALARRVGQAIAGS